MTSFIYNKFSYGFQPALMDANQINVLDFKNHLFVDDDDDPFLSGDSGQLGTEEIFIDVPTIRPPVGFRSDSSVYDETAKSSPNLSTKSSSSTSSNNLKKGGSFQTHSSNSTSTGFGSKASNSSDKESADSALSESESDSGINWSYPDIPNPSHTEARLSRPHGRHQTEDIVKNSTPYRYPTSNIVRKINQRSRSEDRRETHEARARKLLNGETKVVDSANFFMVRRQNCPIGRESSVPINDPSSRISKYPGGRPILQSYQLPIAYRSNFLTRGHSNCDLYSGVSSDKLDKVPPMIPPPDYSRGISVASSGGTISALVHREITKAVKQISGWI